MDDFAQSREPDDLFADEIEPTYDEPTPIATLEVQPALTSAQTAAPRAPQRNSNNTRRGGRRHPNDSHAAIDSRPQQNEPEPVSPLMTETDPSPSTTVKPIPAEDSTRITSVRGDRSATGPAKPTKKTEEELTQLMASMQLKNAAKAEAYARAEKDQASFLRREQQAAAKQIEERKAMRLQDAERAKNRERKIKAQGVREWDSQKQESDIVDRSRGGSSQYSRGAHGGVTSGDRRGLATSRFGEDAATDEAAYEYRNDRGRGRGRGDYRGGRGGRGRDGNLSRTDGRTSGTEPPAPSAREIEFPALPTPAKQSTTPSRAPSGINELSVSSPADGKGNWADEVAASSEKVA
jgi:hypothetical protein